MEFSQEEKNELLSDLLKYSKKDCDSFDAGADKLEALSLHLKSDLDALDISSIHKKNSYLLKEEKARRIVFYSYLSMIGAQRLRAVENVATAKNMGLYLGLNSLAVAQLIHKVRIGSIKRNEIEKVVELFNVYAN